MSEDNLCAKQLKNDLTPGTPQKINVLQKQEC